MADIDIQLETRDMEKKLRSLKEIEKGVPKAVTRALNKAAIGMKTDAGNQIQANYNVKKKSDATSTIKINKADYSNLNASMKSHNRPLSLTKVKNRKNRRPGKKGTKTAFANPKKDGGNYTGGFVAAMPNGHVGIFKRKDNNKSRDIKELYGPGGVQMLSNKNVSSEIEKGAVERFEKELDHQVEFLLKG